jgi:hypothetical protein
MTSGGPSATSLTISAGTATHTNSATRANHR